MSNSIDPDETAHYDPSHLDLRCLQKSIVIARGSEKVNIFSLQSVPYKIYKPQLQKMYLRTNTPSEYSDQPVHLQSLISILTQHILDSQGCKVSSCGRRRLWADCANAQADLSLRWAHVSECTFSHIVAHTWSTCIYSTSSLPYKNVSLYLFLSCVCVRVPLKQNLYVNSSNLSLLYLYNIMLKPNMQIVLLHTSAWLDISSYGTKKKKKNKKKERKHKTFQPGIRKPIPVQTV